MKKLHLLILCLGWTTFHSQAQVVPLAYRNNTSFTYEETIRYYEELDARYSKARLFTGGTTDSGKPLHLFVMSALGDRVHRNHPLAENTSVLFVINGIHPGEPDGIDASLLWSEWLLASADTLLENLIICVVPVFNTDGMLNRGCCSRANQDGPLQYGFRGNARNLDLNRDFIKLDSENARSLVKMLREWDPDFFIDTHVSNGADYQYTFTLLPTQVDKLHPALREMHTGTAWTSAEGSMKKAGFEMTPYVHCRMESPDSGLVAFLESPRFSSGYMALFHTPAVVTETHMLKPFPQRVDATLAYLKWAAVFMHHRGMDIHRLRQTAKAQTRIQQWFPINWTEDWSRHEMITFHGYAAAYKPSEVTGQMRLYYDRSRPYTRQLPYYGHYLATDSVLKPRAYIIPQGWSKVIALLRENGVQVDYLKADQEINVEQYLISDYQTVSSPYEGHYLHSRIKTTTLRVRRSFREGDALVYTGTPDDYFIVSVLEPRAVDSYFAWGFFDSILQQKEWFSNYVWEDMAAELLQKDEHLCRLFEEKKNSDPAFAGDAFAQLYFIYRNSPYYEPTANLYPVCRWMN